MAKVLKAVRDVRNGFTGTYHVGGFAIGMMPITISAELAEYLKTGVQGVIVFEAEEPDVSPEALAKVAEEDEDEGEEEVVQPKEAVKKDGQGKRK